MRNIQSNNIDSLVQHDEEKQRVKEKEPYNIETNRQSPNISELFKYSVENPVYSDL